MEERDKISKIYRGKIDELLNSKFNPDSVIPLNNGEMDEIWEEIFTEMEIDEIWDDISSDLDDVMPLNSNSGIIFKSIAAVLIILCGMIPVKKGIPDPGIIQPDILIENQQNEQSAVVIIKNNNIDTRSEKKVKEDVSPVLKIISPEKREVNHTIAQSEGKRTDGMQITPVTVYNETIYKVKTEAEIAPLNQVISQNYVPVEKFDVVPVLIPDDLGNIRWFPGKDYGIRETGNNSFDARSSDRLINRGRISVGLITSFNNTWLLNYETFEGFKSESLNTTEFVFYPDAGVSLNYALNKSWSLQADAFLYSNTGQEYYEYIYGLYSRKKITLTYSTVALSVKYNFTGRRDFMGRSSINLLAGGYLSVLHHADQIINTNLEYIGSQYGKFDLGAVLGWEIELHISDHLSLAPGFFMTLGIPNIYKGDGNIPGYLRSTRNGSEGIRFAIYYH